MDVFDKETSTKGRKQYHVRLAPGDVGRYVLVPGDPARSDMVADALDDAELKADNREHRTYTGYYDGIEISVTSTGMGCPSAAIAAEELYNVGAEALIRIGSTAAIQPEPDIGDLITSTGSMKNEGTSEFYVPESYPAVPDFELTRTILDTATEMADDLGYDHYHGINATDDAFYGESEEWIRKLRDLGVLNVEMESSALYTIARQRNERAAMISAVSGNLVTGDVIYEGENPGLVEGWKNEIAVVLEAISRFDREVGR